MAFATKVLRPELAQLTLEHLRNDVIHLYVVEVKKNLASVPQRYEVSEFDWNHYLEAMSRMGSRTEGKAVPLGLKALLASSGAASAVAAKQLATVTLKLCAKGSLKGVAPAAEAIAAKTGSKVAAKVGGQALGAIVGVGILIWDFADHSSTVAEQRPILKANLFEYLEAMREDIVTNPETGILAAVDSVERQLLDVQQRQW